MQSQGDARMHWKDLSILSSWSRVWGSSAHLPQAHMCTAPPSGGKCLTGAAGPREEASGSTQAKTGPGVRGRNNLIMSLPPNILL